MEWLARDPVRRSDPREILPGAASVIVLGMNYYSLGDSGASVAGRGRFARYAWGDDYHEVIEPRLAEMNAWLMHRGGTQRYYVDTGPVLERDFARLAGIGWHGKSTMLIHTRLGTWLFLAVVLTTLELPPDIPAGDHCGKCTRCMVACPTGAITAPYRVDARRCVAYLTIEHKGSIPLEFRNAIGDRVYGCDDCLDACPWNRFAEASRETAFAARPHVSMPLRDLLGLTPEGFAALFKGSPIKRIKRNRFLRNVAVALGNVGTEEDVQAVRVAASDPDPLIAEHASWALERIMKRLSTASAGGAPAKSE
jgi:epoxyqueuosine reductase